MSLISNVSNVPTGATTAAGTTGGMLTPSSDQSQPRFEKIVEIVAVLLLGITTIGTAWCGFQSVRWSGASADYAQASSDEHVEAARLFGLATQKIAYDSMVTAQYAQAVAAGDTGLQRFYRNSLVREDFRPILEAWQVTVKEGRAPTPLADDADYVAAQLEPYHAQIAAAEQNAQRSRDAGATASTYVSITILLAAALFFAGVISSFRYRTARALLLAAALATLGVAASRLAGLPVLF